MPPTFDTAQHVRTAAAQPDCLSDVFYELTTRVNRDSPQDGVRLGVLLSAVGRRSYGPLLLVIGLFAISPATILPGMTSVAAAVTLLVATQMAFGMKRPWLPRRVLELRVPRGPFVAFVDRARPHVERVEGDLIRPRLEVLTRGPFAALVALCVVLAALVTFPLSIIPFGPLLPGLAVVLFGIGMTARDGVLTSLGVGFTIAALWLAVPFIAHAFAG
ncbi:MAG TPA: exopolysaccharide biosynthesis protein [Vitreimonas sp.]|uniref:exopolysaccharide biosynthesis protein n=1 Tax=Vitreimonas sp. TaxID=3069702 RepID=UPI002D60A83E|nr:exopolysaccharide biosynthesis protein [Vitreimonas sp.]HYD87412.1 exopolysaccharide biosynthesis protein [Vitreimonas sp.]